MANPTHIVHQINEAPEGSNTTNPFLVEQSVPLSAVLNGGTAVAAGTNGQLSIAFDADNEAINIPFAVPHDYDEAKDVLQVSLIAELTTGNGSTNAIELNIDRVARARVGEDAGDVAVSYTDQAQNMGVAVAEYSFDISGLGHKRGDALSIEIDAQETGTAVGSVYGILIRYGSTLAAFDQADRSKRAVQAS